MFRIECFIDVIFKSVSFTEFIVVVLHFVSLLEVEVVIWEKVVMVLRTYHLVLVFLLYVFVWVEVGCLVLSQFVVIVLIVEVIWGKVSTLSFWISELLQNFLESCSCSWWVKLRVWRCCINIKQLDLLGDIVHGSLEITFFSISWKIERFEGRKSSHKFFVA